MLAHKLKAGCQCCGDPGAPGQDRSPFVDEHSAKQARQLPLCTAPEHLARIVRLRVLFAERQGKRLTVEDLERSLWVAYVRQAQVELAAPPLMTAEQQQQQQLLQQGQVPAAQARHVVQTRARASLPRPEYATKHRKSLNKLRLEAASTRDPVQTSWLVQELAQMEKQVGKVGVVVGVMVLLMMSWSSSCLLYTSPSPRDRG